LYVIYIIKVTLHSKTCGISISGSTKYFYYTGVFRILEWRELG
jgi:hypothetical protein